MIRRILILLGITMLMSSVSAPAAQAACESNFLSFPAWYDGLTYDNC